MKKLIDTAYSKLKDLQNVSSPSWETYSKIADLATSIDFLQKQTKIEKSEISDIIEEMRKKVGDSETFEILEKALSDFTKDLNCIQPRFVACLIDKLKGEM